MVVKSLLGKASSLAKKGMPEKSIVKALKKEGHDEEEIKKALSVIGKPEAKKKGKKSRKRKGRKEKEEVDVGIEFVDDEGNKEEKDDENKEKEDEPKPQTQKEPSPPPKEAKPKNFKPKTIIKTDIDKLYNLVNEKGSLKASDAASEIGVSVEMIEEWARILEENSMIAVRFHAVKGIEMVKLEENNAQ